jgi:GT2 family glycosyltransferase
MTVDRSRAFPLPAFVLHWNSPSTAVAAVESLLASTGVTVDVTVIDNASDAGEYRALIEGLPQGVPVHRMEANLGFTGAGNAALRQILARSPLPARFLIAAHDVVVDGDCIQRMLTAAEKSPDYAALGPVPVSDENPASIQRLAWDVRRGVSQVKVSEPYGPGDVLPMDWIAGRVMLLRTDPTTAVEGFDDRLFIYGEDLDLCLRLGDIGYRSGIVVGALAWDSGHMLASRRYQYYVSRNLLAISGRRGGKLEFGEATVRSFGIALRRAAASLWPLHSRHERIEAREAAIGAALGTADALRGRMGRRNIS